MKEPLFLPSIGWLCGVGVSVLHDRVFSLSPGFAQLTPINNNNNTVYSILQCSVYYSIRYTTVVYCSKMDILDFFIRVQIMFIYLQLKFFRNLESKFLRILKLCFARKMLSKKFLAFF